MSTSVLTVVQLRQQNDGHLRSLRIALVMPAYLPAVEYGGPINKLRSLAAGLQELGHRPEVWCADYGPGRSRVPAGVRAVEGIPVRYFRRALSYRWSPVVPQAYRVAAGNAPNVGPVDVGHCFGMWDGLTIFAAMGFRRARVPYVVEPLGMYPPVLRGVTIKRLFTSAVGRRYLEGSGALIATSDREADLLRATVDTPVVVRFNPLAIDGDPKPDDDVRAALGIAAGVPLIGWIGRVSQSKGLDVLVEALAALPDHHLVLVGPDDGDGASDLVERAIDHHHLRTRVHRLPPRWGNDRDRLLMTLDAFVLPSVTENFGNAAAEAAALGVPVVVSDRVGFGPWLHDAGAALIAPLEPAALAGAIRAALTARPTAAGAVRKRLAPARIGADQVGIYESVFRARAAR